ncbi:MAG: M48 family metallopeptidase [Bacteroidia bacterium]
MASVQYKGKEIEFSVVESNRKTLGIYVHPNLEVEVRAPISTPDQLILEKVEKRKRWIGKQLTEFEKYNPKTTTRLYQNGESHKYLGKQYRLKLEAVQEKPLKGHEVNLKGAYIIIKALQNQAVEPLLNAWYQQKAERYLTKRFHFWQNELVKELPSQGSLLVKPLKKSWGLCKGNVITLNTELIKTPRIGIDYVIIHELCHLKVPYHNDHFRALLSRYLSEWKKHKEILELSYS